MVSGTTEMSLLLLWRHLASYAETDASQPAGPPPATLRTSMRLLPALDVNTFKDEAGKRLVSALTRISSLDLVSGFFSLTLCCILWTRDRALRRLGKIGSHTRGTLKSCLGGCETRSGCTTCWSRCFSIDVYHACVFRKKKERSWLCFQLRVQCKSLSMSEYSRR